MQPKYLIRINSKQRISQANNFTAHHPDITRDSGKRIIGLRVFESTGKSDRNKVTVYPDPGGTRFTVPLTSEALKSHIRKLRDHEAERLDAIDAQLEILRLERKELMHTAWNKANVVTLKEITEKLKQPPHPRARPNQRRSGLSMWRLLQW